MAAGGKRAGQGHPSDHQQGLEAKQQAAALARVQVLALKDLDQFYAALRGLALGVMVKDEEAGNVYARPPDRQALMFLWEQALGKAPVKKEVQQDQSITLEHIVPRPGKVATEEVEEEVAADD